MPLVFFFLGQQDHRNDLSHPIHADNCLLDPEANECWKEPPAYTYRDYRYRMKPWHSGHCLIPPLDVESVPTFTFLFSFQRTVISEWRFRRRGVHIHRNGRQNNDGELLLLRYEL